MAGQLPQAELDAYLADTAAVIRKCVAAMPSHQRFIADHCAIRTGSAFAPA